MPRVAKLYTIKMIDEYGECFNEFSGVGFRERNFCIKRWLADVGDNYIRAEFEDIVQLIKYSGEELWYYEEPSKKQ